MGSSKRVCDWSVEEVSAWVGQRYDGQQSSLQTAVLRHAVSGRALLRMRAHHLQHLGVEAPAQQEVLQEVLLLRVQEELDDLTEIFRVHCLPAISEENIFSYCLPPTHQDQSPFARRPVQG